MKNIFPSYLLTDVPRGEWVALSNNQDRLLGHSPELTEALQQAYSSGEKNPFVLLNPSNHTAEASESKKRGAIL